MKLRDNGPAIFLAGLAVLGLLMSGRCTFDASAQSPSRDMKLARELWFASPQSRHATSEQEDAAIDLLANVWVPRFRPASKQLQTTRPQCLKAFDAWALRRGWTARNPEHYNDLASQSCGWEVK